MQSRNCARSPISWLPVRQAAMLQRHARYCAAICRRGGQGQVRGQTRAGMGGAGRGRWGTETRDDSTSSAPTGKTWAHQMACFVYQLSAPHWLQM